MTRKILTKSVQFLFFLLFIALAYPVGYFVLETDSKMKGKNFSSPASLYKNSTIAYIINLDRSKDRYAYVKPAIDRLNIPTERITAVDGKTLSDAQIEAIVNKQIYRDFVGHFPKKGMIGCSLSHIKAWKTFLDSSFEYAVIFEDDVTFDPIKLRSVIAELSQNSKDWDIVNFETSHRGWPITIKSLQNGQKLVVYLANVSHAGAYMLNRKAATKLLEKFKS